MAISREVRLRRRPSGEPTAADFEIVEVALPDLCEGQVRVENHYLTVDPYMRHQMAGASTYVPPFDLERPMAGGAVGQVTASRHPRFRIGDYVFSYLGWREGFVSDGRDWGGLRKVDPELAPLSAYLGVMGMPGLTAYAGLLRIAGLTEGEAVFVSGAAGAVGNLAGQIARLKGCFVIGSAGSDAKVEHLQSCGFSHAFNYKTCDLESELTGAAPGGLDVYFDNVGGDHLRAALRNMRQFGRIAMCGSISGYNSRDAEGWLTHLDVFEITAKQLTLRGFISGAHADLQPDLQSDVARWLRNGEIQYHETSYQGVERMPEAFIGLFRGDNIGKTIVRLV